MSKDPDAEFIKAEEMVFKEEFKPITKVYVDLEYLQDLRVSVLLNAATVQEEVSYIMHNLDKYNGRYDQHTAPYFKALHFTDEQIAKVLATPKAVAKICVTAPFTSVYYELMTIMKASQHHANLFEDHPRRQELVINCADVDYPKPLQDKLTTTIGMQLGIQVTFEQRPRYTMPDDEYLSYDLLMLWDMAAFVHQHATAFVGNGKFENKKILAQPVIEDARLAKAENPEEMLEFTERNLDVYCDFRYLRSELWIHRTN